MQRLHEQNIDNLDKRNANHLTQLSKLCIISRGRDENIISKKNI